MEYIDTHNAVLERYFDAFIKKSGNIIKETVSEIGSGATRSLVRISPYIVTYTDQKYAKVLAEYRDKILAEDERMFYAVFNLCLNPKIITEMTFDIIKFVIDRMPPQTQDGFINKYKELYGESTDFIAEMATKQATKTAIIYAIATLLSIEIARKAEVMAAVSKVTKYSLTALQIYGLVTKAGISADKLRRQERIIYNLLYSKKIEMLYFIIEPKIAPLIAITASNDHANADALIQVFSNIFHRD
ncbi:hypothetical protein GWD52_02745 [Enterobacteriaceae bacterium 4M9]|nr:hypothetical protein [Enterobacteriaceae bacterium 4M9]